MEFADMNNILVPSTHPRPALRHAEANFVFDLANVAATIATVNSVMGLLLSHQDPMVVAASKVINNLCVAPMLKHIEEIHEFKASVPDVYSVNLPDGEESVTIGGYDLNDVQIGHLPGFFARIQRIDQDAELSLCRVESGYDDYEATVIRGTGWPAPGEEEKVRRTRRQDYTDDSISIRVGDTIVIGDLIHIKILG